MGIVAAYYHIVFCTKAREMTLPRERREDMYRFMWKEIKDLNCRLLPGKSLGFRHDDSSPSLIVTSLKIIP